MTEADKPYLPSLQKNIQELNDMRTRFINALSELKKPDNIDKWDVSEECIALSLLDVHIEIRNKPVSLSSPIQLDALEFCCLNQECDEIVCYFYLSKNGLLYKDLKLSEQICDFNSSYAPTKLVEIILVALFDGKYFKPQCWKTSSSVT